MSDTDAQRRYELIATVILSLATILTAWSGFQSAKWSGLQARSFSEAAASRNESVRASTAAGQFASVDAGVFTSWLAATADGDVDLARLIEDRFRPEFAVAFDEWIAADPLTDPDAPPTPFALDSYRLETSDIADRLGAEASAKFDEAMRNNQRSDNYVLLTVIAAGVLFLGAVGTRLSSMRMQRAMLTVAGTGLAVIVLVLVSFPVEV